MDGAIKNHPEWGNRPRNTNTASSGLSLVWMLAGNLQTVCLDRRTQRSQGASKQPWGRTSRKRGQNTGKGMQEQRVNVVRGRAERRDKKDGGQKRPVKMPLRTTITGSPYAGMYVCVCEICILQTYKRTGNIIPRDTVDYQIKSALLGSVLSLWAVSRVPQIPLNLAGNWH